MKKLITVFVVSLTCFSHDIIAQITQPAVKKQATAGEIKPVTNVIITRPVVLKPIYDFSNVKICIDPIYQSGSLPERNFSAVKPPPRINPDGSISSVGVTRQPLAGETNKMWDPGQTITVFLSPNNGSEFIRSKVRQYAKEWEKYANIKLAFVNDFRNANIKVGFQKDGKSWSWIGKDVLFNPIGLYTVNFGWFDNQTSEDEFRRTIVHEFGHAIGFIHEHQSPAANIPWDKEKVYQFFDSQDPKWTRAEVDHNVFEKYAKASTNFSAYDRNSIMHYSFPSYFTTDGSSFPMNSDLSLTDKQYAGLIYPFPPVSSNATGILRTGDDCDMVGFTVEYNAVASDKVEFVLTLGQDNNKKVTWWKQITIPMNNNTETGLWVQNHSLIAAENRTTYSIQVTETDINKSKGISFWKAKLLGVHTLLGYKWNVLSAIKGGCRVTLVWNRDSCL